MAADSDDRGRCEMRLNGAIWMIMMKVMTIKILILLIVIILIIIITMIG